MPKFIVELWMDGYDTPEEMNEACKVFIEEQLNSSASSVRAVEIKPECYRCHTFNSSIKEQYRCAVHGYCAGLEINDKT